MNEKTILSAHPVSDAMRATVLTTLTVLRTSPWVLDTL